jgi:phage terminase large subunit
MTTATLTRAQAYVPYFDSTARYCLVYGGAGSGKSYAVAQRHILRCLSEPGHRILVVRKVARTLRQSVYQQCLDVLRDMGLGGYAVTSVSPLRIHFPATASEMIFAGVDDPEKLKSIAGITSIWIEEATEVTRNDFDQLDYRIRGEMPHHKQVTLTFNPVSIYSWLYESFIAAPYPNSYLLRTTYHDNPFLAPEDRAMMESKAHTNPAYYRVYTLGEWGTPEGLIYPEFIHAPYPDARSIKETLYGLDFGFTSSATALMRLDVCNDETIHLTEQLYVTGWTNSDLIRHMQTLNIDRNSFIYADAAEPQRIVELQRAGFMVVPAHKDVMDGINAVREVHHLLRTRPENINFNREAALYSYKQDRNGRWLDDPVKDNDHLMDALRYAVFSHTRRYGLITAPAWEDKKRHR